LGGEGPGAQPFDLRTEHTGTGGAPDEPGEAAGAEAGQPARAYRGLLGQKPPVTGAAGRQYPRRAGLDDHIQAVTVLAGQLPQRGRELDTLIVGQVAGAEHGDAQMLADSAMRPVSSDQVRGVDALNGSGPGVRDGGADTVVVLGHPEQLAAEPD